MLLLSRISRSEVIRERADLSALAQTVVEELQHQNPERVVAVKIQPGLAAYADRGLMRVLLDNLLGNCLEVHGASQGCAPRVQSADSGPDTVFFVKDNGAGFDMAHASVLFQPFQRLHDAADFPGTGIGLATVQRVVDHHGGRIWAEGTVGAGSDGVLHDSFFPG